MIFIRHPFRSEIKCINFDSKIVCESDIRKAIVSHFGYQDFILYYNGRKLYDTEIIPHDSTVHVAFSLPGGKGGFGSMLRAIGAQIEKTTNREACRDLSGRRLRDINEEQRLKKWIAKEAEREAEKLKRRKARIERLKSKPSHKFFDFEYEKEISQLPDRVNDALNEGLQKTKHPSKRPAEEAGSSKPPKKIWLSDEFSSGSDSDNEINASGNESSSTKDNSNDSDASQPGPSCSKSEKHSGESSHFTYDSAVSVDTSESKELQKNMSNEITSHVENTEHGFSNQNNGICKNEQAKEATKTDYGEVKTQSIATEDKDSHREKDPAEIEFLSIKCVTENDRKAVLEKEESEVDKSVTSKANSDEEFSPIELLDFHNVSDLEALGLNKLKSELMHRNLKCGGNLSDRAKRLWQVRGLQPHEYPANLLVKNKK